MADGGRESGGSEESDGRRERKEREDRLEKEGRKKEGPEPKGRKANERISGSGITPSDATEGKVRTAHGRFNMHCDPIRFSHSWAIQHHRLRGALLNAAFVTP